MEKLLKKQRITKEASKIARNGLIDDQKKYPLELIDRSKTILGADATKLNPDTKKALEAKVEALNGANNFSTRK